MDDHHDPAATLPADPPPVVETREEESVSEAAPRIRFNKARRALLKGLEALPQLVRPVTMAVATRTRNEHTTRV